MARVRALLAHARTSDRRVSETTRSGTEKLFEVCLAAGASYALLQQLKAIATGPPDLRMKAGHLVVLVLCLLWALVPLSIQPTMPVQSLRLYPLTTTQEFTFHVLSFLQNRRLLALSAVSFAVIITLFRVPNPLLHFAGASAALIISMLFGLVLATFLRRSASGSSFPLLSRRILNSKAFPLARKEFRYFSRTLDPYVALLIALAAGYSEYLGAWMTPAKAMLPMLVFAVMYLPLVLNPFGLDAPHERDRYSLLPISPCKILLLKHIVLAFLFLASLIPLAGSLFYRMSLQEGSITALLILVVLLNWLYTGLILMRLPAARTVRITFGMLSGDGMSLLLTLQATALLLALPITLGILFVGAGSNAFKLALLLTPPLLVLAYMYSMRSIEQQN